MQIEVTTKTQTHSQINNNEPIEYCISIDGTQRFITQRIADILNVPTRLINDRARKCNANFKYKNGRTKISFDDIEDAQKFAYLLDTQIIPITIMKEITK
jgi:uncharacterized protein (UPF0248 family)